MIDVNNIISVENYGNYSSSNYGSCRSVKINHLTLFFSYNTIVGFTDNTGTYVTENTWGPTTGKHLNCIDNGNKKSRLPRREFEEKLKEAFIRNGIINAREEIAKNL